jgi:hypothetical protein
MSVVLPEPRKPVMMVIGIGGSAIAKNYDFDTVYFNEQGPENAPDWLISHNGKSCYDVRGFGVEFVFRWDYENGTGGEVVWC